MLPAITYNHCHRTFRFSSCAKSAGPIIEPIPKNPSTVFMMEVCSAVEWEMSPMSAERAGLEDANGGAGQGHQHAEE